LAELERRHEAELIDWARRRSLPPPNPKQFSWQCPETFSLDDVGGATLSPYQALSLAVRNEERAFAFYTYVAAQADARPEVQMHAESFAREELRHVSQLRALRRRAFHDERETRPERARVATAPMQFHRMAWGLERGAAELTAAAARCLDEAGRTAGASLLARASADATMRAETMAKIAGGGRPPEGSSVAKAVHSGERFNERAVVVDEILNICERDVQEALDAYLTVAERATSEPILLEAQNLAENAVARLALIRSQMG
jgi:hypothetical protein